MTKRTSFYTPPTEQEDDTELSETLEGFKEAFESLNTEMTATREQLHNRKS